MFTDIIRARQGTSRGIVLGVQVAPNFCTGAPKFRKLRFSPKLTACCAPAPLHTPPLPFPTPPLPSPPLSSPHGASGQPPNDSDHAKCGGVHLSTPSSVFLGLLFFLYRGKVVKQLTSNNSLTWSPKVLKFSDILQLDVVYRPMTSFRVTYLRFRR